MRRSSLLSVFILILVAVTSPSEGAKCRGRYMEMRGGDGFVTRGGCRGLDSQIQEEYWTTVGFDGALRDGRTTDDFLIFPEHENNGHRQRNSFVGYWITRSKYGENVHYEAFGHAFIKPDGKVCGWFVGSEKEVVEVCGGFRILSRSRYNPHQPIPFEWVQGPTYRNRDVLGFHSHKIAKYEVNGDEVIFGDADVKNKKFNGVSVSNEERVQVDQPDQFHRKVWLLRKKSQQQPPQDIQRPVISKPKRPEDLDIYKDPHHEERITNWRLYPYYDQYGRPSGSQIDASRPAYDSSGRRIPFDGSSSQNSQYYQYNQNSQVPQNIRNPSQTSGSSQNNPISHNYQYYDTQQAPPRNHPGYEEWLRNQYRIRNIIPRGYERYFETNSANDGLGQQQYGASGRDSENQNTGRRVQEQYGEIGSGADNGGVRILDGNGQEVNSQNQYEQPAYILQPSSGNDGNHQVVYEGRSENGNENSGPRNSEDGKTYYSVNPGDPVDASGAQTKVDNGEFKQYKVSSGTEENGDSDNSKNVVIPRNEDAQQHVHFIRYHPSTLIRDKKGNLYERRVENGKVYYIDADGNQMKAKIDDSAIDRKIERILENRRQEEVMRSMVGTSADDSDPISAAEAARQGSSADFLL